MIRQVFLSSITISFSFLFIVNIISSPARGETPTISDDLYYFIVDGEFSGNIGAAFNLVDYHSGGPKDNGLAWGLLDLKYKTPEFYGFKIGTWMVGVQKIWEQSSGYYDSKFEQDFDFRELYLEYNVTENIGRISAGRKKFQKNPSMDGDSHLGAEMAFQPVQNAKIYFSAINKWINNDRTTFTAKGITGWVDVSEANVKAGDVFFALMGDLEPIDKLNIMPYFEYLENVLAVGGCEIFYDIPLGKDFVGVINGIYAYHANQVPSSLESGYEDVQSALVQLSVVRDIVLLGGGVYWLSKDRGDIMAGIFDTFDPLEEDDYYPYDDLNHATLYYLIAALEWESITLEAAFGMGKNRAYDVDTREFDLWLNWNILPSLEIGGYLAWNDFSGDDAEPDYIQSGSSLSFNF